MIYILYYDHNGRSVDQKLQYVVDQYKKRRRVFLGAGIAVVVIVIFLIISAVFQPLEVFFQMRTNERSDQHLTRPTSQASLEHPKQEDLASMWSTGRCEGKGSTKFKNSPIAVDNLSFIFPMGKMASAHVTPTDHQYWIPIGVKSTGGLTDEPEKFAIYAPSDGYIVSVEHSTQAITEGSKQPPQDDYRVIFEHSCTFYSLLIHVNKVNKTILDQITFKQDSSAAGHSSGFGKVKVKAGEMIGRSGAHQFDFAVINTEVTLPGFVKPQSYNAEPWKIHTVDSFDYFDEPLRSQLTAKSVRTVVPLGGKIDYDISGKLVGNWFREGSGGYFGNTTDRGAFGRYWDSHLSVVYDPIDPTKITISTGNFNGASAQFAVLGNSPDPKDVDEKSSVIKYELTNFDYQTSFGSTWDERTFDKNLKFRADTQVKGVALFQVFPNQKLKVQFFPGQTSSEITNFTKSAQIYER